MQKERFWFNIGKDFISDSVHDMPGIFIHSHLVAASSAHPCPAPTSELMALPGSPPPQPRCCSAARRPLLRYKDNEAVLLVLDFHLFVY